MASRKGGISTAMGRGKLQDLRASQMDKYLADPNLELVRSAGGKLQFSEKKSAPASKPKTRAANKVPQTNAPPLSAFTGRKPRALDAPTKIKVPKPRITDEDLVSPRVKRNRKIAETALAAVPVGRGALAGIKAARAGFAAPMTQRAMSNTIARARPGEAVPPSDFLFPRFKSDTARARAMRETRGFSGEAQQALKRGNITRGEARSMTEGYRKGGLAKKGSRRK